VETWADAEAILSTEKMDVVLLNPELPDSLQFEAFRRSRLVAPKVPVVVLLRTGEEAVGVRMVREGAQDFLIRGQVDCSPLAHALGNAMEREQIACAEQTLRFVDLLTGLPNHGCFNMFAERDRKIAELLGTRWMILLLQGKHLDRLTEIHGEQGRDLALVQMAERLRHVSTATDLIYRVSDTRFAVTLFETESESLEQAQERVLKSFSEERVLAGWAIFDPDEPASLEDLICEASDSMAAMRRSHRVVGAA
jgi:PleD family two-component response regulator